MGGFFGVASKRDCVLELFYGVDYHSHLGTRRGGMATHGEGGFNRAIHNIENSPFRTKFDADVAEMKGNLGIGCISDYEPQPLLIQSHLGSFAITTVGKVNNYEELLQQMYEGGHAHFQEMTSGQVNVTELIAALPEVDDRGRNPLCTGAGRRLYDHAADDKGWNLCGQRPLWKNPAGHWTQGRRILCILRKLCLYQPWLYRL